MNKLSLKWVGARNFDGLRLQPHYNKETKLIVHQMQTGWETTWRNAAVHWGEGTGGWGEGTGGWGVIGEHRMLTSNNENIKIGQEHVTDCSIYDGWWDKNK